MDSPILLNIFSKFGSFLSITPFSACFSPKKAPKEASFGAFIRIICS